MEKVPRKKRKAPLRKTTLLLALLLIAALCGAGAYFLNRPKDYGPPQAAQKIFLLNRQTDEISSLAVSSAEGGSYPLVRGEDGSMHLLGRENVALRQSVIEDFLMAAAQMEAVHQILCTDETKVNLQDFGLSPARLRLVVGYKDGEKKEIIVGNPVYEGADEAASYYCMVGGDTHIYVILATQCDVFFHEADYLRDFDQPRLDASLLDRIEITGQTELTLSYTPLGWKMEKPFDYPVQTAKMDALLNRLENMGFEAYLGPVSEADKSRYGLDQPTHQVIITQAPTVISGETQEGKQVSFSYPEVKYTLFLGRETDQSGVYVLWMDGVYKASNFLLGFWKELKPDEFLLRQPVSFLTNQLSRLTVDMGGKRAVYDLSMVESIGPDNQVETDEYGQTLYDVEIRKDGKLLDTQEFLSWYTQLAGLTPAGKLKNNGQPQDEMLLRITLESEAITRVITLYPYDALHCILDVDGTQVFYTDRDYIKAIANWP